MFFSLLFATFLIALLVSVAVVRAFSRPVRGILDRVINDEISAAWHRYITFAGLVVGISGGVVIRWSAIFNPNGCRRAPASPLLSRANGGRWKSTVLLLNACKAWPGCTWLCSCSH